MAQCGQWSLEGTTAKLVGGALHAEVDLARPQLGLHHLRLPGKPQAPGHLLGVWPRGHEPTAIGANAITLHPEEPYVRGRDLVVMYREPCGEPFWLQLYLRLLPEENRQAAAIETIVSVQTRLWEAYPSIVVTSALQAPEAVIRDQYVVYRTDRDWSYVEATPPGDFKLAEHVMTSGDLNSAPWRFDKCFMERGVIRRLRLRAAIVPSQEDEHAGSRLVEALISDDPPLTA